MSNKEDKIGDGEPTTTTSEHQRKRKRVTWPDSFDNDRDDKVPLVGPSVYQMDRRKVSISKKDRRIERNIKRSLDDAVDMLTLDELN
jgi:hypothetical protein